MVQRHWLGVKPHLCHRGQDHSVLGTPGAGANTAPAHPFPSLPARKGLSLRLGASRELPCHCKTEPNEETASQIPHQSPRETTRATLQPRAGFSVIVVPASAR